MKKVLILGAGLSTSNLIKYMIDHSEKYDWTIKLGDISLELCEQKVAGHKNGEAFVFDVKNQNQVDLEVKNADLVISMLPAAFHHIVAEACLEHAVNMVTASYVSKEIRAMDQKAKGKGIIMLNEIGVDPGIDHMSAMRVIDRIKEKGGRIIEFESNTGGLVAPKYDNNPWNYKFTWNPRNVVLAGQGNSQFLHNGMYKYIPYNKLFERYERINVLDLGEFEAYPNRDSLGYMSIYGLEDVKTIFRGTIRRPGFSKAWNAFVQLGMTSDDYIFNNSQHATYRQFINSYLPYNVEKPVEQKVAEYLNVDEDSAMMYKLRWLGIFSDEVIGLEKATPAEILQQLLESKLSLDAGDIDMIVMQHQFVYELNDEIRKIYSSMIVYGEDSVHTAMSITVGLPMAIAAKMLLTGEIAGLTGVHIPTVKEIYEPIMKELEDYKIRFTEEEKDWVIAWM
ncbi:MAG: saccharopine dehydrogenase NADP-binding domain-containing protein [Deltaproteobacteria bacterium]|nr:saccharopine dehydrogenase NADP-binding domain-containing protein [Deltaproteobacteria bacterium]